VDLQWAAVMGVRYPVQATYLPPAAEPGQRPPSGAALVQTRAAYQQALQAAVAHAAASAAAQVVDREVAQTRQRVHAISDRWVPRLAAALHELTERLEEAERAETVQLRWVAGQPAGGRR
jgi:vacuolar-type H+-ATPase subunit D/Vma8